MSDQELNDHRRLGRDLGLFDTDPLIGAGLPYLRPAGAAIRYELEKYVHELERRAGYQHVYSPVLGKRELYQISGHWQHYRDGMYPPMRLGPRAAGTGGNDGSSRAGEPEKDGSGDADEFVLRPSLCPHHAVIYRSTAHSYRELPLRLAELGGMYRAELSGVLGGLTRVRSIHLNDAHIFCTGAQVAAEAAAALDLIRQAYAALGIAPARYRLSLASPAAKYVGSEEMWVRAAAILGAVLTEAGLPYEAESGEAAFYGPKIDVQVADRAEREASLSTVQVDFYQPERFGLEYTGPDGGQHRPVMVHRSVIGSLERALAHLIDVHGGAFPPWLAPVQLVVLPVTDAQLSQARAVVAAAVDRGLRAELLAEGSLGARIREHRLTPYQAVIGSAEAVAGEASLRLRDGQRLPPMPASELLSRIEGTVKARNTKLWP